MHAGPNNHGRHVSYLPLILLACSAEDAEGRPAALLHSSKLRELLWATLEWMVLAADEFRVAGFGQVRCPVLQASINATDLVCLL
jgi:hypothetical protein